MFISHLTAGDQSTFKPAGPLPANLRKHQQKAFLSMAGICTLFQGISIAKGSYAFGGPYKELLDRWPKMRKWVHYFLNRALTRKVDPTEDPITRDELHFARLGPNWSVFSMVSVIFTFFLKDGSYSETVLAKDGSFTLMMKLWTRWLSRPPYQDPHLLINTHLFNEVLRVANANGTKLDVQEELLREVDGNDQFVASFTSVPIRVLAETTPSLSDLSADDQLVTPSIMLLNNLLGGTFGGIDATPSVFAPAFFRNPKIHIHDYILSILTNYSKFCVELRQEVPESLRDLLSASFSLCSTLLWYDGAVDYAARLLDNGILDVYANLVPSFTTLSTHDVSTASFLLEQGIAPLLSHGIVISAAMNALHRLEKDRKADYDAIAQAGSRLSDAWCYFRGHAFERAALKGIYAAKYRKEGDCNYVSY